MGIQINGQTDRISAVDGSFSIQDLAEVNVTGVATASNFKSGTSNVHSTGYECTNINATGIVTAASANFTGNVSVGGTLTYQDVTNIDSVGVITARAGVHVTGGSVGIGTDNPLQKLHLSDTTSANIYLQTHNAGTGSTAGVYFRTSDSSTADGFFKTAIVLEDDGTSWARGKLHFLQNNTADASNATLDDSVLVINNGNIGIGTDNPENLPLTVAASTAAIALVDADRTNSNYYSAVWGDQVGNLHLVADYEGAAGSQFISARVGGTALSNEKLRISSTGLVNVTGGIQVTENVTPTSGRGVEIFEAAAGVGQIQSFNRTGGSYDELRLKGSEVRLYAGNALKLDVQSVQSYLYGTSDGILNLDTTDGRGTFIRFKENGATKAWVGCAEGMGGGTSSPDQDDLGLRATGNILFSSNGGERLRITENGRVLINRSTATDQSISNLSGDVKLVVNGATITKHGYKADVGTSYVSIPGATVGNESSVFIVTVQGNGGGNFHSTATYILCSGAYNKTFTQLGSAAGHFGNGVVQAQLSSYSGTSSSVQVRRSGSSGTCQVQVHMLKII